MSFPLLSSPRFVFVVVVVVDVVCVLVHIVLSCLLRLRDVVVVMAVVWYAVVVRCSCCGSRCVIGVPVLFCCWFLVLDVLVLFCACVV